MELPGLCDYTNDLKGEDYISDLIPGIAENLPAVCCNHLPLQKKYGAVRRDYATFNKSCRNAKVAIVLIGLPHQDLAFLPSTAPK